MHPANSLKIERALEDDLEAVLALLGEVNLPTEGVPEHFNNFFVARYSDKLIGCIGQERYGEVALLRSLAVSPELRQSGVGSALTKHLIDEAQTNGVREIVLLTTTAKGFFTKQFNFMEIERATFDGVLADSIEWKLPMCSSAVCMHLTV